MSVTPKTTLDLQAARANLSFSPEKLGEALRNDPNVDIKKAKRDEIAAIIRNDPVFDKRVNPYLARKDVLAAGFGHANRLLELKEIHKWSTAEYLVAMKAMDRPVTLDLHEQAFQPVINNQGSDEQKALWMPRCINHEIIGAYLQTELGHGSNVQALETTATWIPETQEFEINSPTIASTKWWIGSLGFAATHGIVQARLILNGKEMGPHTFIAQLRSLKDHSLMPGITAGDIGPKAHAGYSPVDNGWARFDHYRVPRTHMLARFAKVSPTGEYTKPPHSKLSYGGMIYIRAGMAGGLGWGLAKASTIATRYLHQRRQFGGPIGSETQVFKYPSVYMRILPEIARSIVFITIGKDMINLYNQMAALLADGDTTLLAETHAVSSGLKVYCTTAVVAGIEANRRSLGGHGYMASAGVGRLFADTLPAATLEGDNYILNMQVARSALSTLAAIRANPNHPLTPSTRYLAALNTPNPSLSSPISFVADESLPFRLLSRRAALQVARLEGLIKGGAKWEELSWETVEVCRAVVEVFLADRIGQAVLEGGLLNKGIGPAEQDVLTRLITFWKLTLLQGATSDLFEFGIFPSGGAAVEVLRKELDVLARSLLPDAVGLVDSFGFSDWSLDTTVGNFNGGAYEALLKKAQDDWDLNSGDAAFRKSVYEKSIKPILERGRALNAGHTKL